MALQASWVRKNSPATLAAPATSPSSSFNEASEKARTMW